MSFLGDLFGGSSKQTQTATVTNDPPGYLAPSLEFGVEEARKLYDTPLEYFPGQTFVDFAPATQDALNRGEARAMGGNPLLGSAQNFIGATMGGGFQNPAANMLMSTAQGDFLSNSNPFLSAALQPAIDQIQGQFSRAGRLGSGANMAAMTSALAPVYAQNYATARQNQLAAQRAVGNLAQRDFQNRFDAAQIAPQMAAQDYDDISKLAAFGLAREQKTAEQLAEDMARFNFTQNEPQARLSAFLTNVKGGTMPGTGTTSRPVFENPTGTAIGNLANLGQAAFLGSKAFGFI